MRSLLRAFIKRETLIASRNFITSILTKIPDILLQSPMAETESQSSSEQPPLFDPSVPTVPISYPIKTLSELESRAYFDSFHYPFNKASVPLPISSNSEQPNRPRLLVCHDMAGGYVEDKWVQGGSNSDAYAIWHWYLIDVFVYFSHSLVTLPPPSWVNAAHKHGVKVLGTFITEWDEGREICNQLLSTVETAHMYADRLAELAVELGFDGWLLNVENKLDSEWIPNLKEFISHLTERMHSSKPGSSVIWYDSVTMQGDLDWQDQLNDKNKPFFDLCDGIFVNYTWKEHYPNLSAAVAGDRKFDVYFGIDVFGRNTYGGGQWNTNVALDVIKKEEVSAAIFAPGWIYETQQPPNFQTAQRRWWDLVEKSWELAHSYPVALPFFSSFDQGHGHHLSIDGSKISDTNWFNLSSQSLQPFLEFTEDTGANTIQVNVNFDESSYSGGGNITFSGDLENEAYFTTRLFLGNLSSGNLPLHFTYSLKSDGNSVVGLLLDVYNNATDEKAAIFLAADGNTLLTMNKFSSKFSQVVMPHKVTKPDQLTDSWTLLEHIITMEGYTLTQISAVCYKLDPVVHIPSDFHAVLGHLSIKRSGHNFEYPPCNLWMVESDFVNWDTSSGTDKSVSLKLAWMLKEKKVSSPFFRKYNIYVEKMLKKPTDGRPSSWDENTVAVSVQEHLGVAQVECFYVSNLVVPFGTVNMKFIIQACGINGTCQKLDLCPSVELSVEG